jgi:hypothetical protein
LGAPFTSRTVAFFGLPTSTFATAASTFLRRAVASMTGASVPACGTKVVVAPIISGVTANDLVPPTLTLTGADTAGAAKEATTWLASSFVMSAGVSSTGTGMAAVARRNPFRIRMTASGCRTARPGWAGVCLTSVPA